MLSGAAPIVLKKRIPKTDSADGARGVVIKRQGQVIGEVELALERAKDSPEERRIMSSVRSGAQSPTIEAIMLRALSTLDWEITRLEKDSRRPGGLDQVQARQLAQYVRSTADLAREEREQLKMSDLDRMSSEDLFADLKKLLNADTPNARQLRRELLAELLKGEKP